MGRKFEYGFLAAVAAISLLLVWQVFHRVASLLDTPPLPKSVTTLKASEQEKFLVTPNHLTTVKRDKSGKTVVSTQYVPTRANITLDKDGNVVVKIQKFGLCFQPGLGLAYTEGLRIAPNVKLLYYSRLGLNAGLSMRLSSQLSPRLFIALSYAVVSNTSVFVGVDHQKQVVGGLSVRF